LLRAEAIQSITAIRTTNNKACKEFKKKDQKTLTKPDKKKASTTVSTSLARM
jgi:hypothetical protein